MQQKKTWEKYEYKPTNHRLPKQHWKCSIVARCRESNACQIRQSYNTSTVHVFMVCVCVHVIHVLFSVEIRKKGREKKLIRVSDCWRVYCMLVLLCYRWVGRLLLYNRLISFFRLFSFLHFIRTWFCVCVYGFVSFFLLILFCVVALCNILSILTRSTERWCLLLAREWLRWNEAEKNKNPTLHSFQFHSRTSCTPQFQMIANKSMAQRGVKKEI